MTTLFYVDGLLLKNSITHEQNFLSLIGSEEEYNFDDTKG